MTSVANSYWDPEAQNTNKQLMQAEIHPIRSAGAISMQATTTFVREQI
jgi:hypothetical protein